jgi:ADP-heptose:LPS heptosyltransferase
MPSHCFLGTKARYYYSLTHIFHLFLRILFKGRFSKPAKGSFQKILFANFGSLGDLVLSSGVMTEIKRAFPHCQVGIALSNESQEICKTLPFVDYIHVVPFPSIGTEKKRIRIISFLRFLWIEQPKTVREIAKINYDCAIELRPFFPNLIPVFWKAKIPIRIGFTTGGNEGLLNEKAQWKGDQYIPYCYASLLHLIGIENTDKKNLMPKIILRDPPPLLCRTPYLLFHLCSSESDKEFPVEFWIPLYSKCKELGWAIYFTGKGARQSHIIEQISQDKNENLCNRLTWEQLVYHIKECSGLISVDSVPIHVAASFNIPTIALFRKTKRPFLWKPDASNMQTLGIEKSFQYEDVIEIIMNWRRSFEPSLER